jgi:alpha-beta hydrolase superfamily lysophospholipase
LRYNAAMAELPIGSGVFLKYHFTPPAQSTNITLIYVHGFGSHQRAEKALHFEARAKAIGLGYVRFDLRGHGASSGALRDLTLTDWLQDTLAVIDRVAPAAAPVVLIGSSMGGQIAAWAVLERPERVAANLLIAPAFDFYENRLRGLGPEGLARLTSEGAARVQNEWIDVVIGKALLEDASRYGLADLTQRYRTPTLLLHGTADTAVAFEGSLEFFRRTAARPLDLVAIADGDHRLTDHKAYLFDAMLAFLRRLGLANSGTPY